jgi:ketosteroid isomerase-like protein
MRKICAISALLVLSIAIHAQQPGIHADTNASAETEIKTLELKLAEMIVRGEWDEYASNLSSDYLHTRENGHVENKDETLASLRGVQNNGKSKIIVMEMEPADAAIRIYGDVVVASAEFTITIRDSGQVKSRRTRLNDVFVKRDGRWWLVAEHDTTIGK